MARIALESARYGRTGMSCGSQVDLRDGYGYDDMQPLDAPEFLARGSLRAGHQTIDGAVYVAATDAMPARAYGGGL